MFGGESLFLVESKRTVWPIASLFDCLLIFRIYEGKHEVVYVRTPQRCAGLVNVRSAPIIKLSLSINAVRTGGGGSRYKLTGPGGPEGAFGSDFAAYVFVFAASIICPLYKLIQCKEFQPVRPCWGPENFFAPAPEPAVGGSE
jgi:hypothetical protein